MSRKENKYVKQQWWYGISFYNKTSEGVARILRKQGIYMYMKNGGKLQYLLRKKEKEKKLKMKKGVLYKVDCAECDRSYIGETGRRWKEKKNM